MGRISYIVRCFDAGGLTTDFTNEDVSGLYLTRRFSESGYGVGRLCRSVLKCEIPDCLLDRNGRIDVFYSTDGVSFHSFGSFFVTERIQSDGRLRIRAEDCLSRLEQPFTPTLASGETSIDMTDAVFEIGRLCGVDIDHMEVSFAGYRFPSVPRCSCKRMFEYCCSAVGADIYTSSGLTVKLKPAVSFEAYSSGRTLHSFKAAASGCDGHIQVLLTARDADMNSTLHIPYGTSERAELAKQGIFYYPENIQTSDRYLLHAVCPAATEEMCSALCGATDGKRLMGLGFDCKTAAADCDILPGTRIIFEEDGGCYVAAEAALRLSGTGIFARLSAESRTEEEFPRLGRIESELRRRTEENAVYTDVCLDRSGLKFYRGADGGKSEIGGLTVRDDFGISSPEPIQEPTPNSVIEVSDNVTEVYYDDYKLRMTFTAVQGGESYTAEVLPI